MANSRNEDLLENILGGSNEYGEPQSRNEAILQNILGEQNELLPPVSSIETLLLQILEQGGGGNADGSPARPFILNREADILIEKIEVNLNV